MLHFSFGQGSHFLVLRDEVGRPAARRRRAAAGRIPLRACIAARFNPRDGQLYVSGMAGWGTYTPDDGCFQRVRYTGRAGATAQVVPRPRKRRA